MAAGSTYTPIATTTLSSATSSVVFSSISGSYTDLVLVGNFGAATNIDIFFRVNGDSGTNYSNTRLRGDGTNVGSSNGTNNNYGIFQYNNMTIPTTLTTTAFANFMSYSNSTTYKTVLGRSGDAGGGTQADVVLWRNTAAITQIQIYGSGGNILAGSTFTLYGILAA